MNAPKGVFAGVNFMTPNIVAHYKLREGWAELSSGRGMEGQEIFGVTVRKGNGQRFEPDRSRLFQTRSAALDYIKEMS